MAETLGSRLRQARAMRDATIYDVQKQTGISASTLSLYERDLRTPSLDRLETLANFLGASIDWLTGKRNEDWTPERLGILEELKNDPSANTMMKMVVQGRKLGELPEEDMLKIVKFIEFIRHDNRSKK